ncbi:MAG: hypothetical protein FWF02_06155 [Micrococcales bacterium]|nr:hypothetical protein [Micrococcales bacterium]
MANAFARAAARYRLRAGVLWVADRVLGRARDECGAMNIVVVPVVLVVMFSALVLIRNVGLGVDESRQARAAADAAALAAAGAWSETIEDDYYASLWSPEAAREFVGRQMTSFAAARVRERADYFARENGATVVGFAISGDGTVMVRVRDTAPLADTGGQAEHSSTARLRFESGVCRSGSRVGYQSGQSCITYIPPPSPDPLDPGTVPRVLSVYKAEVTLVG